MANAPSVECKCGGRVKRLFYNKARGFGRTQYYMCENCEEIYKIKLEKQNGTETNAEENQE